MTIHYDEKGKFFSDIITKSQVRATIQTRTHRIEGRIFVAGNERPKDALNVDERFLAVTDATVFGAAGEILEAADFIAINREHIIWVIPHEVEPVKEGSPHDPAA
ncbi:MAG TPA: hypothetical protein VMN57_00340 [Anaerolineales bacterium]|nr:hypothetical protein [Anaerolineales bacterium]